MPKPNQEILFDDQLLIDYLHEELDEQTEARIREQLNECPELQRRLETIAGGETIWHQLRQQGASIAESDNEGESNEPSHDDRMDRIVEMLGPTDDPRMLGRLGNYEICGLIGQGSTGIVFKALEPSLNRFVAIKVLSPVFSSKGAARKRFEREGRAVAAVIHENIVPIYAVDEHCGLPYIVMQYVPGVSLLERISKNGALETCEVSRIGLQVASGLAAAHKQGIVHRDVKPANVMLENTIDRAMVMDFGLARVADEGSMTQSGTITGTPQYMSPEQAKGDPLDHRSDLFSLGSLLYAACTARPPFRAETLFGVINRVCQAQPRAIRDINPKIEEWLCELIARMMSKEPDERFQSADEVAEILERELAFLQSPTTARKPSREWMLSNSQPAPSPTTTSHGNPLALAAIGLIACGLAAWSFDFGGLRRMTQPGPIAQAPDERSLSPADDESGSIVQGNERVESPTSRADFQFASLLTEPASDVEVMESPVVMWKELEGDWDTDTSSTYDQKWQQAFKVSSDGKLTLTIDFGDVVLRPNETTDEVSITMMRRVVAPSRGKAEQILAQHALKLEDTDEAFAIALKRTDELDETPKPLQRVLVRVSLPKDFVPHVESAEGNLVIGQFNGDVHAVAKSGKIHVDKIGGRVNLQGTGGCIDLRAGCDGGAEVLAINSDVYLANSKEKSTLKMSGGNAYVGENPGEVYVQTSGGDIAVEDVLGPIRAFALDGDVRVLLTKSPNEDCSFGASLGRLSLQMHSDVAAKVHAHSSRELEDFIAIEGDQDTKTQWSERVFNEGTALVRIASESGDLDFEIIDAKEEKSGRSLGGSGLGGSGSGLSRKTSASYAAATKKRASEPGPGKITTIEVDGGELDGYSLYLPTSHTQQEERYPILVALTGAWGVGGPIENVNHWGLARLIRDEEDMDIERNQLILDSFIVVMPHIQRGQYSDHPETVQEILESVIENFNGDSSRIYLTGLSRGGHGTWGLASKLPNTFAAIAPIAGNISDVEDFDALTRPAIWIAHNTGDSSFENSLEAIEALEKRTDDTFVRLSNPDASETDYMEHRYLLTAPERDHHDAWTEMYTRPELYKWLLAQSNAVVTETE
ncbi:MAG: protein kinase [Planctomycetota bacterium]